MIIERAEHVEKTMQTMQEKQKLREAALKIFLELRKEKQAELPA